MRHVDDFIFLFSDFINTKVEQTSLRNSELDTMFKSLNPEMIVKVVDACHSGTEYIKSGQELERLFKESSSASFKKAYFFFSSSQAQTSIALEDYSVFTKSLQMH